MLKINQYSYIALNLKSSNLDDGWPTVSQQQMANSSLHGKNFFAVGDT